VAGLLHPERVLHQGRFEIRQSVEGDITGRVTEDHRRPDGRRVGAQMDAGAVDEPGADTEAAGRVVVAGDHHRRHTEAGEPVQRVVEELDRGQRGHRPVVHITRHDHRVDLALPRDGDEMADELGLRPEHVHPVEGAAEMPVGRVQQSHDSRN
jgi:hypothetical protein